MAISDLAIQDTLTFLGPFLPKRGSCLLDAGCGSGGLALALGNLGYAVTAIDVRADAVRTARERGIAAEEADVLHYAPEAPFDAVLFSISFHHVFPLDAAIAAAKRFLRPGGMLLLEEFAFEKMDTPTAEWFYATKALFTGTSDEPEPRDPLAAWIDHHRHEPPLHEGQAMQAAVASAFEIVHVAPAPYLYRLVTRKLEEGPENEEAARALLKLERSLILAELLRPIGLRIVARKPTSASE